MFLFKETINLCAKASILISKEDWNRLPAGYSILLPEQKS
jgi:hypothetical protein